MMKRAVKSAFTLILILATLLTFTPFASAAAKPSIKIMCGGKTLNVSPILYQDGRTYAPYDSLFKALGAKASYSEPDQTITAVLGTTTITLGIDDYSIIASIDGEEYDIDCYTSPILDTASGKIYVSIRYAAQALGYVVGWDNATRAITLQSVDNLIAKSGATYTVMDKYLAFNNEFMAKNKALNGSFNLSVDLNSLFDSYSYIGESNVTEPVTKTVAPLTINGIATGVFDQSGEEMSINLKSNASSVISQITANEELDAETKAIIAKLDNTDISLIVNNETGMLYIKSPLICTITGQAADAWLSMETGEMPPYSDMIDQSEFSVIGMSDVSSFKNFVTSTLKQKLLYDEGDYTVDTLAKLNSLFSDQAMVKVGDDYVVTYNYEDSDSDYDWHDKETSKTTFEFDGNVFSGVSYSMSSTSCYSYYDDYYAIGSQIDTSSTEMTYSFTAAGKGSLSLKQITNGFTLITMKVDYTLSDTTKTPAREPADGSNVVSIYDIGRIESFSPVSFPIDVAE